MPAVPESFLKWSPGPCAQGKASRKRRACIGMKVRKSHKDRRQVLSLQGTNPGNGTGGGLPGWKEAFWKGVGGQRDGQDRAVCLGSKEGQEDPGLY